MIFGFLNENGSTRSAFDEVEIKFDVDLSCRREGVPLIRNDEVLCALLSKFALDTKILEILINILIFSSFAFNLSELVAFDLDFPLLAHNECLDEFRCLA